MSSYFLKSLLRVTFYSWFLSEKEEKFYFQKKRLSDCLQLLTLHPMLCSLSGRLSELRCCWHCWGQWDTATLTSAASQAARSLEDRWQMARLTQEGVNPQTVLRGECGRTGSKTRRSTSQHNKDISDLQFRNKTTPWFQSINTYTATTNALHKAAHVIGETGEIKKEVDTKTCRVKDGR